ncbi:MAG: hypothetical protein AABX47_08820 [Nanoarchaeota archaeon]
MSEQIKRALELESLATNLFLRVAANLQGRSKSVQLMRDDNFAHRRDRTSNDIHLFIELISGGYYQLRSYTRHMLHHPDKVDAGEIFLTGYRQDEILQVGGIHSLRQDWYPSDAEFIAREVISQNPDIF